MEIRDFLRGLSENVTTFYTQRNLRARQGVYTRCPCTRSNVLGQYHSCEAHKRYLWPRDIAINEHQIAKSSIREALCVGPHALPVLL